MSSETLWSLSCHQWASCSLEAVVLENPEVGKDAATMVTAAPNAPAAKTTTKVPEAASKLSACEDENSACYK